MLNVESIAARTMLVELHTSKWSVTRLHKGETAEQKKKHGTDAARVLVRVCEHKALALIAQLDSRAYSENRRLTMPSVTDGLRLLPVGRQLEHADEMRKLQDERAGLVREFLADYEREAAAAPVRLNGLYDASMWPTLGEVERRFSFGARYLACPTVGAWGDWLQESAHAAEAEMADRLREALERVRDRMLAEGALYKSVFSNLAELIALVPDLNLTGQPLLAQVAQEARSIANLTPDMVKGDQAARMQISAKADAMLALLGGIQ